jgi:hypothetical protein
MGLPKNKSCGRISAGKQKRGLPKIGKGEKK